MSNATGVVSIGEEALLEGLQPLRAQLAKHPLYGAVRTVASLRIFMESHVFAVWDFMSLLKSLQRELTCVAVPWQPVGDGMSRRLINEIVLGEESDLYAGQACSHFELYLRAMQECGARTDAVAGLLRQLGEGASLHDSLRAAPAEAASFVRSTFAVVETGAVHRMAAAFTFGREDLIPEMFTAFVRELDAEAPGQVSIFRYYLERHIEMDGDEHGPMALAMLRSVCTGEREWVEALESAREALAARLALWDGIHTRVLQAAPPSP